MLDIKFAYQYNNSVGFNVKTVYNPTVRKVIIADA